MTPQRKRLIILVVGRIALAPTAIREKSPRTCTNWSDRRLPFTAPATGESRRRIERDDHILKLA